MNQNSNTKNLSLLIWFLVLLVGIKLTWVAVSSLYLPKSGISLRTERAKSALHYRYRLASDVAPPKVRPAAPKRPVRRAPSIHDVQLVGIYSGKDTCIVTLLKKGKSFVLANGEKIDGFVLTGASAKEAYFEKDKKAYTLRLFEKASKNLSSISTVKQQVSQIKNSSASQHISSHDGIKVVPRNLLRTYTSDIDKAMRDIGLRPVMKNGQMQGYKVRFIRRNSPFAKLGLERGDIIKSINGEDIVDFSGPMGILKSVDSIEGLTLTVLSKNEEKELEYEVK